MPFWYWLRTAAWGRGQSSINHRPSNNSIEARRRAALNHAIDDLRRVSKANGIIPSYALVKVVAGHTLQICIG
jgi:hypothetical protein